MQCLLIFFLFLFCFFFKISYKIYTPFSPDPANSYLFAPITPNLLCLKYNLSFTHSELHPTYQQNLFKNKTRSSCWLKTLNINENLSKYELSRFNKLKQHVLNYQLFTDILIFKDVKRAINDDYYFIFEDFLHQILLIFSRDPEVAEKAYWVRGFF